MSTNYLYGTVLTSEAVAANNRGDNIGNTTTLQKVFHQDDLHTSVSAEAVRFAIRYYFQLENSESVNRSFVDGKLVYKDEDRVYWNQQKGIYIDDDLMGFMDAKAGAVEKEDLSEETTEEQPKKKGGKKPKGKVTLRQSPLAVGRAISLRPYRGELSFNCVSGTKEEGKLSLYAAEMHTTEYQYSFGLNLTDLVNKAHIGEFIDAIVDLPPVAGNHARFAYDFSPSSLILRVTNAHSSKIQNCFEHEPNTRSYTLERLINRIESGDIPANELIIGGEAAQTEEGLRLKDLGVLVLLGVQASAMEARKKIMALGDDYAPVLTEV